MYRRRFLRMSSGLGSAIALAGCASDTPSETSPTSAATQSRREQSESSTSTGTGSPDGIYIQSFQESMSMQGQASTGDYTFALMYTVPHTFWTITGTSRTKKTKSDDDSIHLMAQVWDTETRTPLPETGLSVEITRNGSLVSQETIYPMLSQPMGFHYGGNFGLPSDDTYTVSISVGGLNIRRTGVLEDRLAQPASVEIPLEYSEMTRRQIRVNPIEKGGQQGALAPMEMMTPQTSLPAQSEMLGTVRGAAMSDDARFVVTTMTDSPVAGSNGTYLAVSARTRYNRYVLPAMSLNGTIERNGMTVFDGTLERTLDPDLGYHYGTPVSGVEAGDKLVLSVQTPPQIARHEGYETAFFQLEDISVTL